MATLPRTTSHCGTLPYQRSSYGLSTAALYVDSYGVSGEPVFSHRHSDLVDRVATRTPSIESIHKDPRYSEHGQTQSHRQLTAQLKLSCLPSGSLLGVTRSCRRSSTCCSITFPQSRPTPPPTCSICATEITGSKWR